MPTDATPDDLDEYGRPAADHPLMTGRPGPVVPPPPPRPRSGKWPAFLRAFLGANPRCLGCGRPAETGHHVAPFAGDPGRELDPANIVAVCVPCHFVVAHAGDWHTYVPAARAALAGHAASAATARPIRPPTP